jgi:hypothetical protein
VAAPKKPKMRQVEQLLKKLIGLCVPHGRDARRTRRRRSRCVDGGVPDRTPASPSPTAYSAARVAARWSASLNGKGGVVAGHRGHADDREHEHSSSRRTPHEHAQSNIPASPCGEIVIWSCTTRNCSLPLVNERDDRHELDPGVRSRGRYGGYRARRHGSSARRRSRRSSAKQPGTVLATSSASPRRSTTWPRRAAFRSRRAIARAVPHRPARRSASRSASTASRCGIRPSRTVQGREPARLLLHARPFAS